MTYFWGMVDGDARADVILVLFFGIILVYLTTLLFWYLFWYLLFFTKGIEDHIILEHQTCAEENTRQNCNCCYSLWLSFKGKFCLFSCFLWFDWFIILPRSLCAFNFDKWLPINSISPALIRHDSDIIYTVKQNSEVQHNMRHMGSRFTFGTPAQYNLILFKIVTWLVTSTHSLQL